LFKVNRLYLNDNLTSALKFAHKGRINS
jgi:hypothetical protein